MTWNLVAIVREGNLLSMPTLVIHWSFNDFAARGCPREDLCPSFIVAKVAVGNA
jgi:hypothetical protein